jgi:hypothetical protein
MDEPKLLARQRCGPVPSLTENHYNQAHGENLTILDFAVLYSDGVKSQNQKKWKSVERGLHAYGFIVDHKSRVPTRREKADLY